jgi:hypothetical protein
MAKKALLVGINNYAYFKPLKGCHNDVRRMFAMLTDLFHFDQINRLMEQDVRRSELLWRMNWLIDGAQPGDRLLFHFSGHGAQTVDQNGDEGDRKDELICLYDMQWSDRNSYLLDDELWHWAQRCPPGVRLIVSLDTCNSGTGTRFSNMDPDDGSVVLPEDSLLPDPRLRPVESRYLEPPANLAGSTNYPAGSLNPLRAGGEMNHVLLSAAEDWQIAGDAVIAGAWHGVFTYYLTAVAQHFQGNLTYERLVEVVRHTLRAKGYAQVPQLEGPPSIGLEPIL